MFPELDFYPLSPKFGYGYCSNKPNKFLENSGLKHSVKNHFHNYEFVDNTPIQLEIPQDLKYKIDGFSPNLNKKLHVGHLRNLILANSIFNCIEYYKGIKVESVSLYGASQGVFQYSLDNIDKWKKLIGYESKPYYDVLMPLDVLLDEIEDAKDHEYENCKAWKKEKIILVKSNGKPTYAYSDLIFAKVVGPTHYITGSEQIEHFKLLGLGEKHFPMGLVVGNNGKKLKSRDGGSYLADDILDDVIENLDPENKSEELAINVLIGNLLKVTRPQQIKFDPALWTNDDSPGMYITYTYCRVKSALEKAQNVFDATYNKQIDNHLLYYSYYLNYYIYKSVQTFDPSYLLNYLVNLSKELTKAYHSEKIDGGRIPFSICMGSALKSLKTGMELLGMNKLQKI